MIFSAAKWENGQLLLTKLANGLPQLVGLTEEDPVLTSLGTVASFRPQNQMLMAEAVRSMAYLQRLRNLSDPGPKQ